MTTGIVIPAHLGSTRFPGKPLALVGGKPLLSYAVEAARASGLPWCVATSDHEIAAWFISTYCIDKKRTFCTWWENDPPNGGFVLTPECRNGTERAAHANSKLNWDRVIVLQCDEPDVDGHLLAWFAQWDGPCTVSCDMQESDWDNPNSVAVAIKDDDCDVALYFVRGATRPTKHYIRRHVGLYVYDSHMLEDYLRHPQTPTEEAESLEQLRTMAMGYAWHVEPVDGPLRSVNVPADVEKFKEDARQPVSQS